MADVNTYLAQNYILVTNGRRVIENVPERYRADVQSMLDAEEEREGLDI